MKRRAKSRSFCRGHLREKARRRPFARVRLGALARGRCIARRRRFAQPGQLHRVMQLALRAQRNRRALRQAGARCPCTAARPPRRDTTPAARRWRSSAARRPARGAEIQPQRGQKHEEQQQQRPEPVGRVARRLIISLGRGWGRGIGWRVRFGRGGDVRFGRRGRRGAGRCIRRRRGERRRRGRRRGKAWANRPPGSSEGACRPRRCAGVGSNGSQPNPENRFPPMRAPAAA